jgi:pilus assembly protein CpaB
MKDKIILAIAVVCGLAAFFLTSVYLKRLRADLYAGARTVPVLVAGRDLPAGAVLKSEDIKVKDVFERAVGQNVFLDSRREDGTRDLDRIVGKRLTLPLRKAEPIWWSHVDLPQARGRGFSYTIKNGLRAVSIGVSGEAAVSGLVKPEDRVDILGTFTMPSTTRPGEVETMTFTILQDVSVLATGSRTAESTYDPALRAQQQRTSGYSAVTLEVTPREAELLIFAQNMKGELSLTLRNPEDPGFERDVPEVNFSKVQTELPRLNEYRQSVIRQKSRLDR